jgi:DNA ligase D-like protein (predicted polymerase)/DNA ligase D-like protein (predicted 3'-phosphoesterase)
MTPLQEYWRKRKFSDTPEPSGKVAKRKAKRLRFVVQQHRATRLHWDFRLEADGVLKSWAVPKGPSLDPADKRLAMHVEDHPLDYIDFEGVIPKGNYGAGEVIVWDSGTYESLDGGDPGKQIESGKIKFRMYGKKLKGIFTLVRMGGKRSEEKAWLLIKEGDEGADRRWKVEEHGESVVTRRTLKDVAKDLGSKRWLSNRAADGASVPLTNLDKVLWPRDRITKGDLVRYYNDVAEWLLPHLADRPLTLQRFPNGIDKASFFEKNVPRGAPAWVKTAKIASESGKRSFIQYVICNDAKTLTYLANLAAITLHAWLSRTGSLDTPDYALFDLDPWEGCSLGTLARVALALRGLLEDLGMKPAVKTSGGSGLHVMLGLAPEYDYVTVRTFAQLIANRLRVVLGDDVTLERTPAKRRRGSVYIDWVQIGKGKTIVPPYVVRPREKAPVSMPLAWADVEAMARKRVADPADEFARFTMKTALSALRKSGDRWAKDTKFAHRLEPALKKAQKAWK